MMKQLPLASLFMAAVLVGCSPNPPVNTLETPAHALVLKMDDDALVLNTTIPLPAGVKQSDLRCDYYLCWLDEKTMEHRATGAGGAIMTMGLRPGDYGRGRVCAIAVAESASYISNVLHTPNKSIQATPQ